MLTSDTGTLERLKGKMIPGFGLVMMLACAVFYYRVGEDEYSSGVLLAAISIGLWLGGSYFLDLGWIGCILVQLGFFAVLTVWNVVRDKLKK